MRRKKRGLPSEQPAYFDRTRVLTGIVTDQQPLGSGSYHGLNEFQAVGGAQAGNVVPTGGGGE